ncbi:TPA: pentapeptide repeat-containing protein [Campylobacter lari]|uniref:pentapeptide repeat-containing protein n=1 Tax=Campylobacter lari TaxID=201 RepID=UPI00215267CB|nr:pentapeptide repeat-containing protein [Campylobacter lari]MCR6558604.1 pentapeptide repeat-containing protein [Campylobacter lari]MCV3405101.1 pentapeptide repeat-containing protein [Campylobacter lari]MCV3429590.1 pentapeptide repeat-containing protein [Campylobacter lari]HEC1782681.1 pentapeptide repeat-containing protein [Campylobacter lari]
MQKNPKSYGINIKDTNVEINANTITIRNSKISEIDLNILKQEKINKITIVNCEIDYIYFTNDNNIELFFSDCVFKNQIIARGFSFHKKVSFKQCVFKNKIIFTDSIFHSSTDFSLSQFENEVRFVNATFNFIDKSNDSFENNFREAHFKNKAIFFQALFKGKVNFSLVNFQDKTSFIGTKFICSKTSNQSINNFREVNFNGKTSFSNAIFLALVNFSLSTFENEARFIKTNFSGEAKDITFINDFREITFKKKSIFKESIFKTKVDFSSTIFEGEARFSSTQFSATHNSELVNIFKECVFANKIDFSSTTFKGKTDFTSSKFQDQAYFNMSNFLHECTFQNSIFTTLSSFNGAKFKNKPSFLGCIFPEKFDIDFKYLKYNFKDLENTKSTIKEYRYLFRKLKSNHITHHNLIDASELRTQELYARELELEHQKDKTLKEKVEQYQILFYRKLCDHHTDLALNIKWLIITIGMFASMLFMIKLYKYGLCILNAFNFYGLYLSALGSFILSALALFRCIDTMKAFISINAIIIFWVICYKPKLIFGIANLIGDNSYNAFENLLITLYTLIAGLITFSLQKTARKNTIIPN